MSNTTSDSADLESSSPYGYTPTKWICILFLVLYSLTSLVHLAQAIHLRLQWMIPTVVLCGLSEILGWSGRLWSSDNPGDPVMQISTTIIAPSFLTAAVFNILGIVIRRLGTEYSWLPPRSYLVIFMSLDLAGLIVQAIGGGKAAVAAQDGKDLGPGGDIMMCGVIIQIVGMTLFCLMSADFLFRFYRGKPVRSGVFSSQYNSNTTSPTAVSPNQHFTSARAIPRKIRLMLLGVALTTVWVFIRSIYRTFALANGWTGRIITTQAYFNALYSAPIVLAMFTLNVFHPGWLLREEHRSEPEELGKMSRSQSTSKIMSEDSVMWIGKSRENYKLPLVLELGWGFTVNEL